MTIIYYYLAPHHRHRRRCRLISYFLPFILIFIYNNNDLKRLIQYSASIWIAWDFYLSLNIYIFVIAHDKFIFFILKLIISFFFFFLFICAYSYVANIFSFLSLHYVWYNINIGLNTAFSFILKRTFNALYI